MKIYITDHLVQLISKMQSFINVFSSMAENPTPVDKFSYYFDVDSRFDMKPTILAYFELKNDKVLYSEFKMAIENIISGKPHKHAAKAKTIAMELLNNDTGKKDIIISIFNSKVSSAFHKYFNPGSSSISSYCYVSLFIFREMITHITKKERGCLMNSILDGNCDYYFIESVVKYFGNEFCYTPSEENEIKILQQNNPKQKNYQGIITSNFSDQPWTTMELINDISTGKIKKLSYYQAAFHLTRIGKKNRPESENYLFVRDTVYPLLKKVTSEEDYEKLTLA